MKKSYSIFVCSVLLALIVGCGKEVTIKPNRDYESSSAKTADHISQMLYEVSEMANAENGDDQVSSEDGEELTSSDELKVENNDASSNDEGGRNSDSHDGGSESPEGDLDQLKSIDGSFGENFKELDGVEAFNVMGALCETVVTGNIEEEDGSNQLSILAINDKEELGRSNTISEDIILWEYEEYVERTLLGEMDPISRPILTSHNHILVEIMGELYHFNGDSGEIIWSRTVGHDASIFETKEGLIFVATLEGSFLKCYSSWGELLWERLPSQTYYQPTNVAKNGEHISVKYGPRGDLVVFDYNGNFIKDIIRVDDGSESNGLDLVSELAVFIDPGFEKAVREAFDFGNRPIKVSELESIESLSFKGNPYLVEVTSIEDLRMFKNLKKIQISNADFATMPSINTGISVLSEFEDLKYLALVGIDISGDLSAIKSFGLEQLYIEGTGITGDISYLQGFAQLKNLGVDNSDMVGDITYLSGLDGLVSLYVHNSDIHGDIASLSGLTDLVVLDVSNSGVFGELSALDALKNIEEIKHAGSLVE